ncbi:AMP-binding protein [Streptomyces parvulus]|uniref:AMP-binding protein n=1 Tax=Streptomyces parvulus TaxID=146923 RepID=UPI0038050BCA
MTRDLSDEQSDTIHQAVVRRAHENPNAIALVQGQVRLTYGDLDRASDDYAAHFAEQGMGPGSRVPITLPRSPELVATLLAVLKRGAAYAVLDRRWPNERRSRITDQLDAMCAVHEVPPLSEAIRSGRRPPHSPCTDVDPAAIYFTSGTTGIPKGVISPHRATTRLFSHANGFARFGAGQATAVAAAVSWDAFTLEVWGPLISGGTAVLSECDYLLPAAFASMVNEQGVNTAWLTASLFNVFVDEDIECFRGVTQLMIGGERLSPPHVRRFLKSHPDVVLTNGYGPVESCVFATTRRILPTDTDLPDGIPLGSPVPRTQVYVMKEGRICSPGETGEIHIGGAGLATEYLRNPQETRSRFITADVDGGAERLYRTGDLGFKDEQGVFHYQGRKDRQLKVRGNRIEPQEIEVFCETIPGVERAVVVPISDTADASNQMALFYVPASGGLPLPPTSVRERLSAALPGHCVPDLIESLRDMPLTTNGKIDQLELASRANTFQRQRRSDVEKEYLDILQISDADAEISFSALGGSSLDALRLCAQIQSRYGVVISVAKFMRNPTLNGVLELLDGAGALPTTTAQAAEPAARVPLTGMQAHFSMARELAPQEPALCAMTWRIHGHLDQHLLQAALNDVCVRHEALRAAYLIDIEPVAVVRDGHPGVRIERLPPAKSDSEALTSMRQHLLQPLRIEDAEICRCAVLRVDAHTTLLGITVHHVAFDGWSQAVFVNEISDAYNTRLRGDKVVWPELAPTLSDVARELETLHDPEDFSRQIDHLTSHLHGYVDLSFPAPDRITENRVGRISFDLAPRTVAALASEARRYGETLLLPLLTCYAVALERVLGQSNFCIGVPIARRLGPHGMDAITCLADVLCVRLPVDAVGSSLLDLMETAQPALRNALGCQDVRFSELVAAMQPKRTGRNPLYQTMFAYQSIGVPSLELDGCTTEFFALDPDVSMAELVCEAWPVDSGGLRVDITFQADRVAEDVVWRIADSFHALIRGVHQ